MATQTAGPAGAPEVPDDPSRHLTPDDRIALLRHMLLMRGIEERAMNLYRQGKVPGLLLRRLRAGGRERRLRLRHEPAGPAVHPAPRPRRAPRARRRAGPHPRPVPGPRGRRDGRPRRQRPLRRPPRRLRRDGLDAPRHDARRHGHGDGVQAARRGPLRDHVVRRRLDVARRLPRGDELGRRAEAAGRLRAREQPVRLLDAARPAVRRRPRRAGRGLRLPGRDGRRQRRRGDVRGHARSRASARSPARARRCWRR